MTKNQISSVLVVIALYNLGEFVDDAINSVLKQSYNDWHLILVNDGSTEEKSIERTNFYKSFPDKRIEVIDKKNDGVVISRNLAASKYENTDFICFLDADDIYAPDFLNKSVSAFETSRDKNLGFVTSNYVHFGRYEQLVEFPEPNVVEMLVKNSAHTASLIKREIFEEVRGYDKQFSGYMDWDLWLSIIEKGYTWEVIKEPLFMYRVRKDSMVSGSVKKFDTLFDLLYKKHKALYTQNDEQVIKLLQKRYLEFYLGHYALLDEVTKKSTELSEMNLRLENDYRRIKNRKVIKLINDILKSVGKEMY